MEHKRGVREGSRLPELTKRTILLLKEAHPEWGCERISAMLLRGPALPASASAVARVLHEAGYELEEVATRPHADKVRHFERVKPNQLWQTDLFTFVLKRQNGVPKPPFYMTGRVGGQSFSVHAEGERVILRRAGGARQEVELVAPEIAGTDVSAQTRTLGTDAEAASGGAEAANRGGDAADVRAELPRPLCPQGLPEDGVREDAADVAAAPGASPLDKAIDELPQVGAAMRWAAPRSRRRAREVTHERRLDGRPGPHGDGPGGTIRRGDRSAAATARYRDSVRCDIAREQRGDQAISHGDFGSAGRRAHPHGCRKNPGNLASPLLSAGTACPGRLARRVRTAHERTGAKRRSRTRETPARTGRKPTRVCAAAVAAACGAARRRTVPVATAECDAEKRRQENAPPPSRRAGVARGAGHRRQLVWAR
jgi:hypothetical protein